MSNVFVFRRPPHGVITEYFGGGKGGSTTTTNNVTQIPPEVLARYNAVNARAETVAQAPYQAYCQDPNAFVAPLSQTQQAGIQNTNIMAGAAQPYYGAATGLAAQSTGNVNPSALNVGQYMNPFTQNVINSGLQSLDIQRQQALNQVGDQALRTGAFGGSRQGISEGVTNAGSAMQAGQLASQLQAQNFAQAQQAAQNDINRNLQAQLANQQAGLSGAGLNLTAANNLGTLAAQGQNSFLQGAAAGLTGQEAIQANQQAQLDAAKQAYTEQQQFPLQQLQIPLQALGATPYGGTTTQTSPGPTSNLGLSALGGGLAGARIGSMLLPGVGTGIGAIGGGLLGLLG